MLSIADIHFRLGCDWIDIPYVDLLYIHWIGLRENLQETMVFTIKYRAFL